MKKLVLALTVVLVLSGIFAVAAFTEVTMDRDVTAEIRSDTNANVAIYFQEGTDYNGVFDEDDGVITIALGNIFAGGFNPNATFVVGGDGAEAAVFGITNNSTSSDITVTIDGADPIDLLGEEVTDGSATIGVTQTGWFHFGFDTPGGISGGPLQATLRISEVE